MKVVQIVREDYALMENHEPRYTVVVATIVGDYPSLVDKIDQAVTTAVSTVKRYYVGHDRNVYPRFYYTETEAT